VRLSPELCAEASALIAGRLGLDFPPGRQADLERGLLRACKTSPASTPAAYLAWLATMPDSSPEWRRLAGQLTVGETYFFRDRAAFEALERHVLLPMIDARRAEGIARLRIWSAACATGEEPYSLAILLDRLLPDAADWTLTILATDINGEALETARHGCYRQWSFRETSEPIRDRYFRRRGDTFEVDARIRRMVTFAPLNLAEDGYPAVVTNTRAMDLILCRNVLMYFTREAQRAVAGRLQRALVPGGWLLVSPAEASAELFSPLAPLHLPGAIFYRKEPGLTAPHSWSHQDEASTPEAPAPVLLAPLPESPTVSFPSTVPPPELPSRAGSRAEGELEHAHLLANQGDLDGALGLCENVTTRNRLDPEAYLLLAAIRQERGEVQAALEALRRTIYLTPDSAPAHLLQGMLLFRQGRRDRAQRSMQTVVNLLSSRPPDEVIAGSDGLTSARLLETARAYLEQCA
jgi:chemotaxis protein methyltransferase CheR